MKLYNGFRCRPKIVAIPAGEMKDPWDWAPSIISLQILNIGQLDIVATPGEFTTMSGRRLRNAVNEIRPGTTVIAGLCNSYINYIATPEEYEAQESNGGATLYGKYTLPAIIQTYELMATAMNEVRTSFLKLLYI